MTDIIAEPAEVPGIIEWHQIDKGLFYTLGVSARSGRRNLRQSCSFAMVSRLRRCPADPHRLIPSQGR